MPQGELCNSADDSKQRKFTRGGGAKEGGGGHRREGCNVWFSCSEDWPDRLQRKQVSLGNRRQCYLNHTVQSFACATALTGVLSMLCTMQECIFEQLYRLAAKDFQVSHCVCVVTLCQMPLCQAHAFAAILPRESVSPSQF